MSSRPAWATVRGGGGGEEEKENSNPHSSNKKEASKYNQQDCDGDGLFKLMKVVGMGFLWQLGRHSKSRQ